jgi:acyl carrier protein phosphodiesterase
MNYLAHLYLNNENDEYRIGCLLADFTRIGNNHLYLHFTKKISDAVILHRRIDAFTDSHEDVLNAVKLIFHKYRHYARIIVDIYFDHFLSIHWTRYSDVPMREFIDSIHNSLRQLPDGLPPDFVMFVNRMISFDILDGYSSVNDLREVFKRVGYRLNKCASVNDAWQDLLTHHTELDNLFESFFPQLIDYCFKEKSCIPI